MAEFAGRVAVITGAGSGIGRALARALAARGARLVAADRDRPALADLAAELDGVELLAQPCDVARGGRSGSPSPMPPGSASAASTTCSTTRAFWPPDPSGSCRPQNGAACWTSI
ncbi:MAG: hypothetical protein KatS3mg124_0161 [Porticoccaceae bacterium]|nr:MAG: hypothetical protein KatS3mg124_0161 [Porticoccaceae bacterium]